jgi:fatty-acyl-CoA synthase
LVDKSSLRFRNRFPAALKIQARGYQSMIGYFNKPEATAETIDPDGWLRTGDLGTMDARGYVQITGRIKDMIIRGGENIYPREIEAVLFAHPDVADVAVFGIPDPHWGEIVGAVIRAADPAKPPSATDLRGHCRAALASFKTPVEWFMCTEFPLTGSGKVQKLKASRILP